MKRFLGLMALLGVALALGVAPAGSCAGLLTGSCKAEQPTQHACCCGDKGAAEEVALSGLRCLLHHRSPCCAALPGDLQSGQVQAAPAPADSDHLPLLAAPAADASGYALPQQLAAVAPATGPPRPTLDLLVLHARLIL
ncbi:MAG: hypothetical protein M5U26_24160 [Planctomycetota bacterium]|nr:hypothetical protein [Planctomycetota bacterium]